MYKHFFKRFIDIVLSFIGIVVLALPMIVFALIIKAEDPGPAFFKQKRIGIHKTQFSLLKFRSMKMSTPHDMPTHMLENPEQYIAVAHDIFKKITFEQIKKMYSAGPDNEKILVDVKGIYSISELCVSGLRFWRL